MNATATQVAGSGSVRVLETLSDGSVLIVIVAYTKKGESRAIYNAVRIGSDFGDGFELTKIPEGGMGAGELEQYHVHLSNEGHTCTCPAGTYGVRNRPGYCKHAKAMAALSDAGSL